MAAPERTPARARESCGETTRSPWSSATRKVNVATAAVARDGSAAAMALATSPTWAPGSAMMAISAGAVVPGRCRVTFSFMGASPSP